MAQDKDTLMAVKDQGHICLTLEDALHRAQDINLQVMMANARLEQTIARIAESRADLWPHLDGTLNSSRQTADLRAEGLSSAIPIPGLATHVGPYNTFDARLRMTMALFDPSAFERFQAAKKGRALSEAEVEKTREDVLALVADLFIDAQRKQQTVGLFQKILERDQMMFELSAFNVNQGTGTDLDSKRSKSDLDQTKFLYAQAKLQAKDALLDLEAALQIPLGEPVVFLDDKVLMRKMQNETDVNFDGAANADMAVAASQLDEEKANQKTAVADFLPKVSGTADYGRSGASPTAGSNTYTVGLQATLPIWEGGQQQADLKEANAQIKEAQENLEDTAQQSQVDIAKARVAIAEAEDLKQAKAQERETAQKSLLIAFHARQIGSGTVLQVVQAKAELASAEDDDNEAQATWVMAYIDLFHAQGRLRDLVKTGE